MAGSTKLVRQSANLSLQQMESAIPKINRRINDLNAFDVATLERRTDPKLDALRSKLETLLADVFGEQSTEYARYHPRICDLDSAPYNMYHETPLSEVRDCLRNDILGAISQLESIVEGFTESLEDAGRGQTSRSLRAYDGLELHPEIERAVGNLFRDGHYANAVEDAVKALNSLVRLRSGVDDKDGVALMQFVFSASNPILRFNGLVDESDRNEQVGFMQLFCGAVSGLRNPRAHKLIVDDSERALEFIAFVSLLAKLCDSSFK